jgi:hypothetical protein
MHQKMRKIWQKLIADRRRFGLFCGLLFVGLLLWARIIVIARPPRTAVAEPHADIKIEVVLASDNQTIPVSLETEPMKNPFSVSEFVFPIQLDETDNNPSITQEPAYSSESDFVASLKLEAVMGEMAMINGKVLKIGDVVGFGDTKNPLFLESVQGRTVILMAGNHRYELSIAPLHR